ncbi:MAG: 2-phospho-L-lactate guanylyltransferase [Nitrososphaerota archaeon]|nr:2-phospho-L-lactate guanylyltransferase [Nitrososphaerota archaeon]
MKPSGKSRLSGVLAEGERRELALLFLEEVMAALRDAGLAGSTFVVSSDDGAIRLAGSLGARAVRETADTGVNGAVSAGIGASAAPQILVLPTDLPFLQASDLRRIVALREGGAEVVIAPSAAFDGTNALLFPRSVALPLSYDSNSFWNHLSSAAAMGLTVGVCTAQGVMSDIDSPDDLRMLAASRSRSSSAAFARRVLG